MAENDTLFAGRDRIVADVVGESMRRVRCDLPVVLLAGPPGSGRSTMLDSIRRDYATTAPTATIGYLSQGGPQIRVRAVLADLMLQFDTRIGGRRLTFPRVLMGLAALDVELGIEAAARRRVLRDALRDRQGTHQRLARAVGALAEQVRNWQEPPPPEPVRTVAAATDSLTKVVKIDALTSRIALRTSPAARWYRTGTGERLEDPLDALALLNRWERGLGPDHPDADRRPDAVDAVLVRAFLADLAAGYGGRPSANARALNCLLLLRRADSGHAANFVRALVDARDAAPYSAPPDPLLIVGTASTRLPSPTADPLVAAGRPVALTAASASASWTDWRRRRDALEVAEGAGRAWLYAVPLPPMAGHADYAALAGPGRQPIGADIRLARRVSHGHPRAARMVLAAIDRDNADEQGTQRARFEAIATAETPEIVEGLLAKALETGPDAALLQWLITASAVRYVRELDCQRALGLQYMPEELAAFLRSNLWIGEGPEPELHPALRRLLLLSLAARPADSPDSWRAVHTRLADESAPADRALPSSRMYHLLARYGAPRPAERDPSDLRTVLQALRVDYERTDKSWWLDELDLVTSAPRAVPLSESLDAAEEARAILAAAPPDPTPISELAVARWVAADPLRDPNRVLRGAIQEGYRKLADRLPIGEEKAALRAREQETDPEAEHDF